MDTKIRPDKSQMGKAAAAAGAEHIRRAIAERGAANIIVATGASQFEMLGALVAEPQANDPAGFTLVLDDTHLAIPERPGNRRADGFSNVLANPHVGLIYLIPGRTDTLRVNGRARLVRDAPFFDRMAQVL